MTADDPENVTADDPEEADPFSEYAVVRSIHGDYSIWPTAKSLPLGWEQVGVIDTKQHCLDWISEHWEGPTLK